MRKILFTLIVIFIIEPIFSQSILDKLNNKLVIKIAYDVYIDGKYENSEKAIYPPAGNVIAVSKENIATFNNILAAKIVKFKNTNALIIEVDEKTILLINKLISDNFKYTFVLVIDGKIKAYNIPIYVEKNIMLFNSDEINDIEKW